MLFTDDIFLRIDRSQAEVARLEAQADNSQSTLVRSFGAAVGIVTRGSSTLMNRVVGIGPDDADLIDVIIEWYKAHDIPPRIDVSPALQSPALTSRLQHHGLANCGMPNWSRRVLAGAPATMFPPVLNVEVCSASADDVERIVSIEDQVWKRPPAALSRRVEQERTKLKLSGFRRYVAKIDGDVVSTGNMHLHDRTAYLNNAATLETYRGKGCQLALLRHRLIEATAAGCDLVHSLVSPDSTSQRNMQRIGLVVACDREIWMPPDWLKHPFYA